MLANIPSAPTEIDATDASERVTNDDAFFMMHPVTSQSLIVSQEGGKITSATFFKKKLDLVRGERFR